MKRSTHR